jgi:membrane protein YqaA with SNARE-associated domain
VSDSALYLTSFLISLTSGFIPLVSTELYVLSVSALAPGHQHVGVALMAALGQITAKTVIFLAGAGAADLTRLRHSDRIVKVRGWLERHRQYLVFVIFLSALAGLPPFYLVSVAAGAMRTPLAVFIPVSFLGRFLRFLVLVELPGVVSWWWVR